MKWPAHQLPEQTIWLGAAIGLFLVAAVVRARLRGLSSVRAFACAGAMGLVGLVGARVLWIVFGPDGPVVGEAPWSTVWSVDAGGFASFGAMFGAGVVALGLDASVTDRRDDELLDAVVPAGFFGLAVARVGCLSAGCDYGRRVVEWWGIRYPADTPAWVAHVAEGWISPTSAWSASVHPFPVYLVVVTLGAVIVGRRIRADRGEAWGTAMAYCMGRFLTEWFRSPLNDVAFPYAPVGINQIWAVVGIAGLGYVYWRRQRQER